MPKNGKRRSKGQSGTGKPLTRRKTVQASNKQVIEFVSKQVQELREFVTDLEKRVAESHNNLWENQKKQNNGLGLAEEHVVLLRRVLNDALGGITRVTRIERRKEDSTEVEEAQVIDWGWYGEQLHYSDDPATFVNGVVLTEEELEGRKAIELEKRRRDIALYAASRSAEKDEGELRRIYEEGTLEEMDAHLQQFLPRGVEWEDRCAELAPEVVDHLLQQREAARRQQEKMEESKERAILGKVVRRLLKEGHPGILEPEEREALVASELPRTLEWTDRMGKNLPGVIEAIQAKMREEMEAAKEKLLEETKQFGQDASRVIELIQSGKEAEARAAMAELENRVAAKEQEAAISGAPELPEGASVFGG